MVVPKRRTSKSRKNMRSSGKGLATPSLSRCPNCQEPKMPHRACYACGFYKRTKVMKESEKS